MWGRPPVDIFLKLLQIRDLAIRGVARGIERVVDVFDPADLAVPVNGMNLQVRMLFVLDAGAIDIAMDTVPIDVSGAGMN
jgi:hypothetical protein